jgi:trans-aconitate methyltransferase
MNSWNPDHYLRFGDGRVLYPFKRLFVVAYA